MAIYLLLIKRPFIFSRAKLIFLVKCLFCVLLFRVFLGIQRFFGLSLLLLMHFFALQLTTFIMWMINRIDHLKWLVWYVFRHYCSSNGCTCFSLLTKNRKELLSSNIVPQAGLLLILLLQFFFLSLFFWKKCVIISVNGGDYFAPKKNRSMHSTEAVYFYDQCKELHQRLQSVGVYAVT